jgi:type II secretory pathway component PulC
VRTITPRRAVSRAELDALLGAGPGALLSRVRVEAVHTGRRFQGWRLLSVPSQPWLAPGDVVSGVNGLGIERPEQLSAIFEALREAPEIAVAVERAGFPATVRIPIVD